MKNFADELYTAIKHMQCPVVMGLDPLLSYIPDEITECAKKECQDIQAAAASAILKFNKMLLDAVTGIIPAVKPQIAYYELYGIHGIQAFHDTITYAKEKGFLVIADAKRNDIGSTAAAYADALIGETDIWGQKEAMFAADAVTVNAYLGIDGIQPFLDVCKEKGKGIFILVRTSNPSAGDFQDLVLEDGKPLYERVAEKVNEWGIPLVGESGYSSVGAVVGATWPEQASIVRKIMPAANILVPGYGAQGGSADAAAANFDKNGYGAIVNASRSLMCAYKKRPDLKSMDFQKATYDEAVRMKNDLNQAVEKMLKGQ